MKNDLKRFIKKMTITALLVAVPVLITDVGHSQSSVKTEPISVDQIRPAPSFDISEISFKDSIAGKFDVTGELDAIYKNRIVVDDTSMQFSAGFFLKGVSIGQRVGIELDNKGKVTGIHPLSSNF